MKNNSVQALQASFLLFLFLPAHLPTCQRMFIANFLGVVCYGNDHSNVLLRKCYWDLGNGACFDQKALGQDGSMEIGKLHACDLRGEHEDGSFESHQDLTGTIWNVLAFASSVCNTADLTLLVGRKPCLLYPTSDPDPALHFLLMRLLCPKTGSCSSL